jgi:hypothetical protein
MALQSLVQRVKHGDEERYVARAWIAVSSVYGNAINISVLK